MSDSPRLTFHNRANVTAIDPVNVVSATPLGETIEALKAALPVELIAELWQRDWQAEGFGSVEAYGIEGGLTPKRIRTLLAYAGGSSRLQKLVSSWLPSLSVGFAVAIGDNDTLMQFRGHCQSKCTPVFQFGYECTGSV